MNEQPKNEAVILFEAVMDSNKKNVEYAEKVIKSIDEAEITINNLTLYIDDLTSASKSIETMFTEEDKSRKHFLESIPKSIDAKISDGSQKTLDDLKKNFYIVKSILYVSIAFAIFSLIGTIIFSKLATRWYETSINTKAQLERGYEAEGKSVYRKEYVEELENNTTMFNEWLKKKPRESKSFEDFQLGREMRKNNSNNKF